jgi:hypothetical protein
MQTTKDGMKKYGSSYAAKRYDSYHAGSQPGESNENEHAEPKKARSLDAEPKDSSVPKNEHAESAHVETPESTVASHGPAHTVHYSHDHDNGTHTVSSEHEDGHVTESSHGSTAEAHAHGGALAYEAGGESQNVDVKRMDHKPQQSAKSEEENWEMPDLA